jgi:hypothetical protein
MASAHHLDATLAALRLNAQPQLLPSLRPFSEYLRLALFKAEAGDGLCRQELADVLDDGGGADISQAGDVCMGLALRPEFLTALLNL